MLRTLLFSAAMGAGFCTGGSACAQSSGPTAPQSPPAVQPQLLKQEQSALPGDQKIERLQLSDGYTVIDELRVGGESQGATVQTRLPLPAYQVLRSSSARGNGLNDSSVGQRPRVWNILNF